MISLTNPHFYISIALSLFNAVILCFLAYKFFQTIQLSGYRVKGLFSWLVNTKGSYLSRLLMLSLLSVLSVTVTNTIFQSMAGNIYLGYIGLTFYFVLAFVFIRYVISRPSKVPLKNTHRMNRYIVAFYIVSAVATFFSIDLFFKVTNIFRFCIVALTPMYVPVLALIVHFLTLPFEDLNRLKYVKRARKIIAKMPNLKTIAITGSFGKTSTKFFLQTILSEKFNVVSTPNSFNTPMGITKTITSIVKPNHDIFIAEYGATHVGDIKYLCKIVQPDISVLLNIGTAHLSTFSTVENIAKTKYEIIENLKENGLAVFNMSNEKVANFAKNYNKNKLEVSTDNTDIFFSDIKVGTTGTSFTLNLKNESESVKTKVLGEHNLNNILVCVFIASYLGLSISEIANGINKIKPMKNRLELIKSSNGITILDDSFNCNETGAVCALNVLKKFHNRKILLTPGMIDLGEKQYDANFNFASLAGKICDKVIVVNKANREALEKGLLSSGFNFENILFYDTLLEAQLDFETILQKGDVLLIENDLPDNYV